MKIQQRVAIQHMNSANHNVELSITPDGECELFLYVDNRRGWVRCTHMVFATPDYPGAVRISTFQEFARVVAAFEASMAIGALQYAEDVT